jgi:hypothetical protein
LKVVRRVSMASSATRRLVFHKNATFTGWSCSACGWVRPILESKDVETEFANHDCAGHPDAGSSSPVSSEQIRRNEKVRGSASVLQSNDIGPSANYTSSRLGLPLPVSWCPFYFLAPTAGQFGPSHSLSGKHAEAMECLARALEMKRDDKAARTLYDALDRPSR